VFDLTTHHGRRPIVWIVDDSPTERLITERSLGDGYTFVQFSDGADVVEKLSSGAPLPDVLLLDWVMPGMSGDEVCRFLRSQLTTKDLPIIMVTSSRIETNDVVAGLALGANDYVARPFVAQELCARVNAVLRAKQLKDVAQRERMRLAAINQLGRNLFEAGINVQRIIEELATTLTSSICDGCSILMLPGDLPPAFVARHHADPTGAQLAAIATVADPAVFSFTSSEDAARQLPPAYQPYIARFGMRGLAILPFPARSAIQGVVTVTRDGASLPLDPDDISTIETCIEYASLAVQNAMRFDAEQRARAQLDAVLTSAPIGIVVAGGDGSVILTNEAAALLIPGIEKASNIRDAFRLARWTAPDGSPIEEHSWIQQRDAARSGARVRELVMHHGSLGAARTLSVSTVSLLANGADLGDVTTIEDVSAARENAAERERIALFQEQMIAIVGHDLRNPLGAVLAGTEAIELHAASLPAVAPLARRVLSSVHRMNRIVEQLLDVTRARLGTGIPIEPRAVLLKQLVRSVLDELALAHPASTFDLVATDDVQGIWDPDRLAQVVSNLASNAVQYGNQAHPILVEIAASEHAATICVRNAVRDKPIDPARLGAIFDLYQRGSDERHVSGLGLGLYIVSEIVRAHQGTIAAESTLDGTVFRVVLPRRALDAA
jgi:sigma-B regulation protein RsbU (phosphoserine phosphatase)